MWELQEIRINKAWDERDLNITDFIDWIAIDQEDLVNKYHKLLKRDKATATEKWTLKENRVKAREEMKSSLQELIFLRKQEYESMVGSKEFEEASWILGRALDTVETESMR